MFNMLKNGNIKICHLVQTFLPVTSGGVENYVLTLSKYLNSSGIKNILLLVPHYTPLLRREHLTCLEICRTGSFSPPLALFSKRYLSPVLNYLFLGLISPLDSCRYALRNNIVENVDLFHVHSGNINASVFKLGYNLSSRINSPYIVTFHQKFGSKSGDLSPSYKRYNKFLKAASHIIVHRKSTLNILKKWGLEHKTSFMPVYIDIEKYRKPRDYHRSNNKIRILAVGGLSPRRDPLTLTKAFCIVSKNYENVELHFVGSGAEDEIRHLASRHKLEKRIFLHGEQFDVRNYLWKSDIFASLNISDNYPSLALREAMAAGLVPIATDVGETSELIRDGENGLLVPPSDPVAVSSAIATLVENEKMRKKLSLKAKLSSENFGISHYIRHFINIYYKAMSNK